MTLSVFYHHAKVAAEQHGFPMEPILQTFRNAGIRTVELDRADATLETRALLDGAGLRVGSVPLWFNFAHAPFDAADTSFLEAPLAVGASHILILPEYFEAGEDREAAMEKMIEGIAAVSRHCHAAGIIPCIEDFDNLLSPTCQTADIARILNAIPELGMNFDTGNFAITGEDSLAALDRFGSRIVYAHAKDRALKPIFGENALTTAEGTSLYPCPVGRGTIPFAEIFRRFAAAGTNVPIAIECYGVRDMLPAVLASAEFLRPLL